MYSFEKHTFTQYPMRELGGLGALPHMTKKISRKKVAGVEI
jgi:hypothetical protein